MLKRQSRRRRGLLCAFALSASMAAGSVSAALISLDDVNFGPDSITRDTSTNLEWLDVLHTMNPAALNGTGYTRAQVTAGFAPGGLFEGFRYATTSEFQALLTNAGIAYSMGCCGSGTPGNIAPIQSLQELVGVTQGFGTEATKGFLDGGAKGEIFARNGAAFIFDNDQRDAGGSWLVRAAQVSSPVPEPSTLALLAGVGFMLALRLQRRASRHPHAPSC